ncbi:MAG: outer-membrane lipoprotein carrier protein LolA, partial [Pseudomonadota bacterium]
GLVSAAAIALAFGPQIQLSLQAVVDEATAQTPAIEDVIEDVSEVATDTIAEQTAPESQDAIMDDIATDSSPIETVAETVITQSPIDAPEPEVPSSVEDDTVEETLPVIEGSIPTPVQNGSVPETEWPTILADASEALAAAKTARGAFIQSNADGSVVTGTFALNRPGRMRFDYDDPTPILIVSDGTTVAMEDSELETVDRIPIGTTPLGLLLSTRLDVDQDVDVLSIMQRGNDIGIRVQDTSGELEGTLTMVFDKATYGLKGWLAMDGNDQTTVVDLVDVETNVRVDPRLFRLNEDDDEEDER